MVQGNVSVVAKCSYDGFPLVCSVSDVHLLEFKCTREWNEGSQQGLLGSLQSRAPWQVSVAMYPVMENTEKV